MTPPGTAKVLADNGRRAGEGLTVADGRFNLLLATLGITFLATAVDGRGRDRSGP